LQQKISVVALESKIHLNLLESEKKNILLPMTLKAIVLKVVLEVGVTIWDWLRRPPHKLAEKTQDGSRY